MRLCVYVLRIYAYDHSPNMLRSQGQTDNFIIEILGSDISYGTYVSASLSLSLFSLYYEKTS